MQTCTETGLLYCVLAAFARCCGILTFDVGSGFALKLCTQHLQTGTCKYCIHTYTVPHCCGTKWFHPAEVLLHHEMVLG